MVAKIRWLPGTENKLDDEHGNEDYHEERENNEELGKQEKKTANAL